MPLNCSSITGRATPESENGQLAFIVPIRYKDYEFQEKLRIDVLVDRCLVVEAKALDEDKVNMPRHKAQCLSYMKLMNLPLGLIINFGDSRLGHSGVARVILKGANTPDA